jgi:hypothetical protein
MNQLAALTSGLRKTYGPARAARGPSLLSLNVRRHDRTPRPYLPPGVCASGSRDSGRRCSALLGRLLDSNRGIATWQRHRLHADGNISLLEAIDGATIRSKSVVVNGRRCIDYFEPKTGGQWRLVCERT